MTAIILIILMLKRCILFCSLFPALLGAQTSNAAMLRDLDTRIAAITPQVVTWRRDIHQHPELSFQETRTAALVAAHLKSLGLEVTTGVGGNGVVGILHGAHPGPVVALRAELDALPVTEPGDLPYKSTARAMYNGQEVGVMHACGHDTHVAMLMGAADVLTGMKAKLNGTVKFIFQPAEESAPVGGAGPMIAAGVLENPHVDAIFALHVGPGQLGTVTYHAGGTLASSDAFHIVVHGKQTHGAMPWAGVDPIVVSAQIVLALQTIVSRQLDLTHSPSVISVSAINGGNRDNIIPDSVVMVGTIRTFDETVRRQVFDRVTKTAEQIASASGASATVKIDEGYPATINDPALTERMLPTVQRVVGASKVSERPPFTTSDDFSRFAQKVPGFYIGLGVTPPSMDWRTAAPNHSPLFVADDGALPIGVRIMAGLALDYLNGRASP
ncbi:MAG TPA: amidohydrolase [Gemmatimonadaceae bacterium]|jgi:amidohydrolase